MNEGDILKMAAEAERIRANSAEALWILRGIVPPKLPDAVSTTAETNPLRRVEGRTAGLGVGSASPVPGGTETRLDYSAALPPGGKRP
jgi:hypothetical protein